ncbi:TetR/AcrR family transcriptional regulator [Oceanobacillus profundus]|uniref:TetR/AcrR family transcriptional regulator n=1 Tax=Oceanobacillus profundus TaxID=372463 RepID=A0A417YN27_9BACI|nr:TetR/AcrR family transcriptional regulator [Oceanobacillus profundus]MCM3398574.1 TetR/AcrR family transcriptional regulator [Oceanobacillus profundus]MDO6447695.1 TetR/AcrR family transcriptional regulator [Oceanobacillus profundus]PAE29001.1 TetR family transcriptional regulator [Paenibacillus sp. 7884-2]RHW35222.1 TetR/AcrR family transcriptional regulator [Oceanobacillus profundus]
MPKLTFFNLPEMKRNKLIRAAEAEFSRVPLSQASISNIVKAAEIPRGSFYQYFENKEDAYYFLLEEQWNKRQDKFIASLNKYNGDIFEAFKELFQLMLEEKKTEDGYNFLKNALLNVTHEIEDVFTRIFDEKQIDTNRLKEITPLINKECLNISGEDEFYHIIQIITSVTFRNLVEKYSRNMSKEEALENFIIEMNLLKKGLYK